MSDDKIRFRCPKCDKSLGVAAVHAGKRAKCPGCGNVVAVPNPEVSAVEVSDFETLMEQCMAELQAKTTAHQEAWGLGSFDQWAMDQDTGLITFTSDEIIAIAPAQIIGTFSTKTETWLWGWD